MTEPILDGRHDFSLVLGGPIFQLFRKSHLSGDTLDLLHRRLLIITGAAWLPMLLLALLASTPGGGGRVSFFHDVEVHIRFLVALPILIGAELIVHRRVRPVVRRFVDRRIVLPQDMRRFDRAIDSAVRIRNSVPLEAGLLVVAYAVGLWVWNSRVSLNTAIWYALPEGRWSLTPAGYWYVFVALPIVQFVLLRWYFRLFIWFRFLGQVSRINLNLIPGQELLCIRSRPVCPGCHARGPGCQPRPLQRGEPVVVQAADRRLHRLFRAGDSRTPPHVHSANGTRKKKRAGQLWPALSNLCREVWKEMDRRPSGSR